MGDTPRYINARSLRSKVDQNSCFPLNLTNDYVYEFAVRLDTQVKKCLETTDKQDITNLIPIIVETLTSLDQYTNELVECQRKRDSLQEKLKTKNQSIKEIKRQLEVECRAHQDTILDSDTHILELTEEKRVVEEEFTTLKKKIATDKINIVNVNKRIGELNAETNEFTKYLLPAAVVKQILLSRIQIQIPVPNETLQSPQDLSIFGGDSNVRGIGSLMGELSGRNKFKVLTSCIPGGGLCEVSDAFIECPLPGDIIIIHAGTNDICSTQWTNIQRSLSALISKYPHCSIIVFSVPPRHDYLHLNKHINKFNTLMKYELAKYPNAQLIPTKRLLKPSLMKPDGIHYNSQGRTKIAKKMLSFNNLLNQWRDCSPIPPPPRISDQVPATTPPPEDDVLIAETFSSTTPTLDAVSPPGSLIILTPPEVTNNSAPTTHPTLMDELEIESFF
ncbi:hypothetical protein WDU94_001921 [Cyamophila willieti]